MLFKQVYQDDPLLIDFTKECSSLGYKNNSRIENLKFDYFEYCRYIAGIQNHKIYLLSGVHNFDFDNKRFYRIGFRGVSLNCSQIPSIFSSNYRASSLNVGVIFYLLIAMTEFYFGSSEFIVTTNDCDLSKETAGKSHLSDRLFKSGKVLGVKLLYQKIQYLYTVQNVWLIDKAKWREDFEKYHKQKIRLDDELNSFLEN
jgi:hypothetical protein